MEAETRAYGTVLKNEFRAVADDDAQYSICGIPF